MNSITSRTLWRGLALGGDGGALALNSTKASSFSGLIRQLGRCEFGVGLGLTSMAESNPVRIQRPTVVRETRNLSAVSAMVSH